MRRHEGFTLVELMVAMVLSLILIGGAITVFYSSRLAYQSTEDNSRVQETGRLALEVILRDIRNAGWQGCSREVPVSNVLNDSADVRWNFAEPVAGFDVGTADSVVWAPVLPAFVANPAPLPGSDVVVLRGPRREARPLRIVLEMTAGTDEMRTEFFNTTPPIISAGDVVQIADCSAIAWFRASGYAEDAGDGVISRIAAAGTGGNATEDLGFGFREGADVVPVETVIYYIGQGDRGEPALYRRTSRMADADPSVELFEGVEGLQVLYGVDNDGNLTVDDYLDANAVAAVGRWPEVVAVTVALLVRSPEEQGIDVETRDFALLDVTYPAGGGGFNDRRRREVFTATATVRNRVQ
ncbi:MAG: PilW family protein [Steroidobacteraceae bacterium]|jgi:type IV pilus assembly protein PilW|nr:PilW family protein [Steroidobacteraceae bacterium]